MQRKKYENVPINNIYFVETASAFYISVKFNFLRFIFTDSFINFQRKKRNGKETKFTQNNIYV